MYLPSIFFSYSRMTEDTKNPWEGRDLEEFLFFCCPECDEKNYSKELFLQHALKLHPMAKEVFGASNSIKVELEEDINNDTDENNIITDYDDEKLIISTNNYEGNSPLDNEIFSKGQILQNTKEKVIIAVKPEDIIGREEKIKTEEKVKSTIDCSLCEATFTSKTHLLYHISCDHAVEDHASAMSGVNLKQKLKEPIMGTRLPTLSIKKSKNKDSINSSKSKSSSKEKTCHECGKTMKDNGALNAHIKNVHSGKSFTCHLCGKKWPTAGNLKRHIDGVHEKIRKTYQCEICNKTLSGNSYLKIHMEAVHQKIRKWNCDQCSKDFAHKAGYLSHIEAIHKGIKVFCEFCQSSYTQRTALRKHLCLNHEDEMNEQNKEKGGIFPCNECQKVLFTEELLKEHLSWKCRYENGRDKDQNAEPDEGHHAHQCDYCEKAFLRPVSLKKHKILRHEDEMNEQFQGEETFSCNTCSKILSSQDILKDHQRFVHPKKFKTKISPGSCNICGKMFKNKAVIKDHIKVIHEKIFDHQCEICGKACSNKSLLNYHLAAKHDVNTKNNCPFCGKRFGRKGALDRHIESVHEGLKHQCHICQKKFTQSCYLKNHIRKHHA